MRHACRIDLAGGPARLFVGPRRNCAHCVAEFVRILAQTWQMADTRVGTSDRRGRPYVEGRPRRTAAGSSRSAGGSSLAKLLDRRRRNVPAAAGCATADVMLRSHAVHAPITSFGEPKLQRALRAWRQAWALRQSPEGSALRPNRAPLPSRMRFVGCPHNRCPQEVAQVRALTAGREQCRMSLGKCAPHLRHLQRRSAGA